MRLGQLSRKVEVKPSEILSYLKNEFDVEIGSHLNSKVDDALAEKVIQKFSTVKTKEPQVNTEPVESAVIDEVLPVEEPSSSKELEGQIDEPIIEFDRDQEIDANTRLNAEVIKAPKVELTGPTVVGKIDLPPSLEEQMVEIDGVMISKKVLADRKKEERKQKREKHQNVKKRTAGSARSARIKSEAQLEQIKKDQEADAMAIKIANREKRLAKKHKLEAKPKVKVNPVPSQKKVKKKTIKKQLIAEEVAKKQESQKPKPTTWYGKLWVWFNS